MDQAFRSAAWGSRLAAITAFGMVLLLLGPSTTREITKTVVDTIKVPIEVPRWFFWKTTSEIERQVPREITETVFDVPKFLLLLPVALTVARLASFFHQLVLKQAKAGR